MVRDDVLVGRAGGVARLRAVPTPRCEGRDDDEPLPSWEESDVRLRDARTSSFLRPDVVEPLVDLIPMR